MWMRRLLLGGGVAAAGKMRGEAEGEGRALADGAA